jgi:hypothetical protein
MAKAASARVILDRRRHLLVTNPRGQPHPEWRPSPFWRLRIKRAKGIIDHWIRAALYMGHWVVILVLFVRAVVNNCRIDPVQAVERVK